MGSRPQNGDGERGPDPKMARKEEDGEQNPKMVREEKDGEQTPKW